MWAFIYNWCISNSFELFGFIAGILYIFFSIRQNILLWPVGIITSAAYIAVFLKSTLYADMGLQVYYLVVSIYGWYHWLKGKSTNKDSGQIVIIKAEIKQWFGISLSIIVLTAVLYYVMKNYTNASNPFCDGLVSAGSIVATWMLAQKMIEQWLLWIIIDGISIGLFIYKNLYLTAVLFSIYTILAVIGYIQWKKQFKLQIN